MNIELQRELGIENADPARKQRIFALYDEVMKLIKQHDQMLRLIKISLMTEQELLHFRSDLASKGLEWTPKEAIMVQNMIKLVLKHM